MWKNHTLDEWVKVAQIFSYCVTPLIAAGVAVIGFIIQRRQGQIQKQQAEIRRQQAETQHQQYRLALFDKRMKVFDAVTNVIDRTMIVEMWVSVRNHTLLFGPEIHAFIKDVYGRAIRLSLADDAMPNADARKRDLQEKNEIRIWFEGQLQEAEEKFGPYIDFRKP